jgi:hypothetical protein
MKQNDAFPSNYLKAEDFAEGEEKELVISKLTLEEMTARDQSKENKPVLHFKDFGKQIVVNATNWKRIVQVTGQEDSDNWAGKKVTLYTEIVDAFGEMKPAIRVKLITAKQAAVDAFWSKARELGYSREDGLSLLKKHDQNFDAATAELTF